jgi:general secretion pathway protein N
LSVGTSIAGLDLTRGLAGPLRCAEGRAQAALTSQSGMERLTLSFDGGGAYRAEFAINADDPTLAAALSALGFRAGNQGFVLVSSGRF